MAELTYKTYGTHQRGMRLQLGEGLHITFSDALPSPHFATVTLQNRDNSPNEKGLEIVKALEKTNAFHKGAVFYVPSPEELAKEAKIRAQEFKAKELIEMMEDGLFVLNLETKTLEQLRKLADSIGATTMDKKGRFLQLMPLKNAICSKLGINPFKTAKNKDKE